jgi:hypothetical protein
MAKLTIRSGRPLKPWKPKTFETVRSCLYEMNRVEEINLFAFPGLILEEIFRDLPKSAPQLHTLCIDSHSYAAFRIDEDFIYAERLQSVELTNCKISWDSRLLTGLTRLTLEDSLTTNSSIIQVLHALQQMPALIDLHLKDSIPDDSEGSSTYPVVDLPCLRDLSISCNSSGVDALTTVLRHITFPHITFLNLTCREYRSNRIDFSNFLSVLTMKFLSSLVIQSLRLEAIDNAQTHGLEFELWTPSSSPISAQPLIVQLDMTWPSQRSRSHVKVLTCAFDAMSLRFLTKLEITTDDCIDSPTWVKTFGKLPLLDWVCVRGNEPHSFLRALMYKTPKTAKKSKTPYHNVPFPKLRCIRLEETDFSGIGPSFISVDMLLDYLMARCERKAAVHELDLNNCFSISSDDVERLGEIVVNVKWDGIEREVPEEDSADWDGSDSSGYVEFSWS